jgi:hypothetical protein
MTILVAAMIATFACAILWDIVEGESSDMDLESEEEER